MNSESDSEKALENWISLFETMISAKLSGGFPAQSESARKTLFRNVYNELPPKLKMTFSETDFLRYCEFNREKLIQNESNA
ncbi:MAG TPA: hypothetical protein PK453_14100 [Leptospiraceae bacterium]|nr:hypothetical protein [Leptospiraceae bacterium]HMY68585.1 hypothetical protein [Leptospiraceae bacterium]HNF14796.1 hypothetical protein [Leptospiraceae bacterium]HNF25594.1 hypothetical protein [Leptospiraceae bacterium]HNI98723.1 hypothetical protein [Leptospiraceae bacterium]